MRAVESNRDMWSYIALAYGSKDPPMKTPADPNYNVQCDIDWDGDVDSTDVFIYFTLNYGQSYW